ncbi:putative 3-methyladenine DNA glycosylase [metagenome]|uniref:Putative 3-methyladenine DNA glycosylase n=1 Tax=metagenome TaxID=256318 RepID=A0A2P2BWP6_9ZZZZ
MPELVEFLSRPAVEVAPELLGAEITANGVTVRLTEVEAYAGPHDPGSHAFRRTPRSAIMYGAPGILYCYLVYGMHVCANVVTGGVDEAGAVLLRAGEVVAGEAEARVRRPGVEVHALARGPANLGRVLGLSLADNGLDLVTGPVRLTPPAALVDLPASGPRVGLRRGADTPWRFWVDGNPSVSSYRPAAVRARPPRPS